MISNIEIKNYKSIKEAELSLAPLTLFSGLNALGKSSIIQVLLLLRQSFKKNNRFENGLILNDDDLINLGLSNDVFSIDADMNTDTIDITIEFDYQHEIELQFKPKTNKETLELLSFKNESNLDLGKQALFSKNTQYLSANRINPQTQYKTSNLFVEELNSLGKTGEYTVHYIAKNQDKVIKQIELKHPKAKSDTLLDNINAWLSEISPGVKATAKHHHDLQIATLGFQFETKTDYTDTFKPTHVGFGLTYVLPVITALLMSKKDDLVIIENPESHLHPAGQSKIGHLCALASNIGIQVLLESHSDHVLNGIRVAVKNNIIEPENTNIFFFQRDRTSSKHETEIIQLTIAENGSIDEFPTDFMDEWEKQLNDLLK